MAYEELGVLLDYHGWARDRMLRALAAVSPQQFTQDLGGSFSSLRDTAVHICAVELAWYSRCRGESPAALLSNDAFLDVRTPYHLFLPAASGRSGLPSQAGLASAS